MVVSNAFGVPAIAVDTHVFRVSNRLGLAEADDVLKTELQLQKAIPKKDWLDMHHRIIFHGRRVCHSQRPACAACTLQGMCKAYDTAQKTGTAVLSPKAKKRTTAGAKKPGKAAEA